MTRYQIWFSHLQIWFSHLVINAEIQSAGKLPPFRIKRLLPHLFHKMTEISTSDIRMEALRCTFSFNSSIFKPPVQIRQMCHFFIMDKPFHRNTLAHLAMSWKEFSICSWTIRAEATNQLIHRHDHIALKLFIASAVSWMIGRSAECSIAEECELKIHEHIAFLPNGNCSIDSLNGCLGRYLAHLNIWLWLWTILADKVYLQTIYRWSFALRCSMDFFSHCPISACETKTSLNSEK